MHSSHPLRYDIACRLLTILLFAMTSGCSSHDAGVSLGPAPGYGLAGAIGLATAPYVIIDLASGTVTTAAVLPDLTNPAFRTSEMVFRRIQGLGADYFLGIFEVTQGQWQVIAPSPNQPWTLIPPADV